MLKYVIMKQSAFSAHDRVNTNSMLQLNGAQIYKFLFEEQREFTTDFITCKKRLSATVPPCLY